MCLKIIIRKMVPSGLITFLRRNVADFTRITNHRNLIESECPYIRFKAKGKHIFFGYYDILPFNSKNQVLYHEITKDDKPAKICIDSVNGGQKKVVAKSQAWNWQQGSRLRWFPNSDDVAMFNDFDGKSYFCRFVNINSLNESKIDYPLYDISPDGKIGLSLDFNRLGHRRPGYGYTQLPYQDIDIRQDGIQIISVKDNKLVETVRYKDIATEIQLDENTFHDWYLNHLSFSPSGNKFLFFFIIGKGNSFKASLLVYDLSTKAIKVIEKKGKVSHYDWLDDDTIICTCYIKNECRYNIYHVTDGKIEIFNDRQLKADGHPTYISSETIVTDTYPDSESYQTIYKATESVKLKIAKLFDKKAYTAEKRTDLHPRISKDRRYIAVDANMTGFREFIIFNVKL